MCICVCGVPVCGGTWGVQCVKCVLCAFTIGCVFCVWFSIMRCVCLACACAIRVWLCLRGFVCNWLL